MNEEDTVTSFLAFTSDSFDHCPSCLDKNQFDFRKQLDILRNDLHLPGKIGKYNHYSLLKKVKCRFFRSVYEAIKMCLVGSVKLPKLPQKFIRNISLKSNKELMNKKLIEIFREYKIIFSLEDLSQKDLIKPTAHELLSELLSLNVKKAYKFYKKSQQFIFEARKMNEKEGKKFSQLYKYVSHYFIEYFSNSKCGKNKKM
jgi:hypothetical protein